MKSHRKDFMIVAATGPWSVFATEPLEDIEFYWTQNPWKTLSSIGHRTMVATSTRMQRRQEKSGTEVQPWK